MTSLFLLSNIVTIIYTTSLYQVVKSFQLQQKSILLLITNTKIEHNKIKPSLRDQILIFPTMPEHLLPELPLLCPQGYLLNDTLSLFALASASVHPSGVAEYQTGCAWTSSVFHYCMTEAPAKEECGFCRVSMHLLCHHEEESNWHRTDYPYQMTLRQCLDYFEYSYEFRIQHESKHSEQGVERLSWLF